MNKLHKRACKCADEIQTKSDVWFVVYESPSFNLLKSCIIVSAYMDEDEVDSIYTSSFRVAKSWMKGVAK